MTAGTQLIGVTGSTGQLGGMVAQHLFDAGAELRLLARNPERAPKLAGAEAVACEYANTPATRAALDGVATLFMVSAHEGPERLGQHLALVDAAAEAGVEHIVYVSFYKTGPECTFLLGRDHWETEQHIRASGMRFTFLRDNFYAEMFPLWVGEDDTIRGPAGDGKVTPVSRNDVAEVAATVLQHPAAHADETYSLTGSEELTMTEIAAALSTQRGTSVHFVNETIDEARASRMAPGVEDWQIDAWISTYTAFAAGELVPATSDVATLLGRQPRSFARAIGGVS